MLAAGLLHIRRLPGVARPAIAVVIPARSRPSVLIDAGANADARARAPRPVRAHGLGVRGGDPRRAPPGSAPALDRRGAGEGEPAHARGARALAASGLNFLGNTEARDLLRGAADVVVTDGFTGNVALKLLEGTIRELLDALREEIGATARGKLGGLLIRPAARRLRQSLDPDTYGGAYLLGLRGLSVIAHGNSSSRAIANAIRLAARGVEHRVVERLGERLPDRVASARS